MVSVPNGLHTPLRICETKFLCVPAALPLGSAVDGWKVVWRQPDRHRVLWHVMLFRPRILLRGCCDPFPDSSLTLRR